MHTFYEIAWNAFPFCLTIMVVLTAGALSRLTERRRR